MSRYALTDPSLANQPNVDPYRANAPQEMFMPPQQPYNPNYEVNGSLPSNGTIIQYSYSDPNHHQKAHDWNENPNGGCCTIL